MFLSQKEDPTYRKAMDEMTKGIFLECQQHGPESYKMSSSYYYMGEMFRKQGHSQYHSAKAYFGKIVSIWKKFVLEQDLHPDQDWKYSCIDSIYYEEADQHLRNMLHFFEMEFGPHENVTAECLFAYALVSLKIGNDMGGLEAMQKSHMIFANNLGEYDQKTKEVEEYLIMVENTFKQDQR